MADDPVTARRAPAADRGAADALPEASRSQSLPITPIRGSLDTELHDLTNAISSAQAYSDVILRRVKAGTPVEPALVESLVAELLRAGATLRVARRRVYRPGDNLSCTRCGNVFVYRGAAGTLAACRRCRSTDVERWRPPR